MPDAEPSSAPPVRIGFIGTGLIGTPMVQRLLECGRAVSVWNRTPAKAASLVAEGATMAESPRAIAETCDIVCLCLTNTMAVEDVVFGAEGLSSAMRRGQLLIDLSSIAPDGTAAMAARLDREAGACWVDAPVSGGLPAARAGTLIVFAGGNADDVARAAPVFDALARQVTHMGGHGAGQLAKSCNQLIVGCNLMVIAEMLAFARASGIDATRMPKALAGGFADSLPLQIFGTRMANGIDTPPIGALATFRKDVDQVVRLAGEVGAAVPMTSLAASLYREAAEHPDVGAGADVSRIIRVHGAAASRGDATTSSS